MQKALILISALISLSCVGDAKWPLLGMLGHGRNFSSHVDFEHKDKRVRLLKPVKGDVVRALSRCLDCCDKRDNTRRLPRRLNKK